MNLTDSSVKSFHASNLRYLIGLTAQPLVLIIGLKRCTSLHLVDADPIGVTLHRPLCLSIASSYRIVNRCRRIVKCLWSLASQLLYLLLILRGHKVCGMLRETCWRSVLTVCSIADSHIV